MGAFATTPQGLEELVKSELVALNAQDCQIVAGGVHYQADQQTLYQTLLWSRLASRILLPLSVCKIYSDVDLYLAVRAVDWPRIFAPSASFMVQFHGSNEQIRHSQYGVQRVKDGIVDSFTSKNLPRVQVDRQDADLLVHVWLYRDTLNISLDLSGALHQRGYRLQAGLAPLKENLAQAIVRRSGWRPGTPLLDPLCGSGTLLIEAAMLACDCAPGLRRARWGLAGWAQHDEQLWQMLKQQAQQRAHDGLVDCSGQFYGFDVDSKLIELAKANARRAGVGDKIRFSVSDVAALKNPLALAVVTSSATEPAATELSAITEPSAITTGTIISNPPYGERLASEATLLALHGQLGRVLKRYFSGWRLSLFSGAPELLSCLQLRAQRQFKAKNGALDCVQKNYLITQAVGDQHVAEDYRNRLLKNVKKWDKWAKQQGTDCYRIYDTDLPDYNLALDRYGDWLVMQEYAAPKTVDPHKARQRLLDAISATLDVLQLPADRLVLKTRQRQKGNNQYQKLAQQKQFIEVGEFQAKLLVNLTDYLDSGLFADHRLVRQKIGQMSKGKDFLNLFAYTGTASVHAGLGGARSTTTVDMSRTYLQWAERNLRLNGLTGYQHRLIQADCMAYLQQADEQFDVIFIDPPTFSNSKRMTLNFDVQRDHLLLLERLLPLLRCQGMIIFSCNKRGFWLDEDGLARQGVWAQDISQQTLAADFSRRQNLHHCWLLSRHQTANKGETVWR